MKEIIIIVSSVISLAGTIPYIRDIWRGKTKPRIVSWLTWGVLTGVATAASYADHHYPSAILAACMTLNALAVVTLGVVKHGRVLFDRFDIACQLLVVVGLITWYIFQSPTMAVIAVIVIDAIAGLPTLRHAYKHPEEETAFNFATASIASLLTLFVAGSTAITAIAYPLYLVLFNGYVVYLIARPRHKAYAKIR